MSETNPITGTFNWIAGAIIPGWETMQNAIGQLATEDQTGLERVQEIFGLLGGAASGGGSNLAMLGELSGQQRHALFDVLANTSEEQVDVFINPEDPLGGLMALDSHLDNLVANETITSDQKTIVLETMTDMATGALGLGEEAPAADAPEEGQTPPQDPADIIRSTRDSLKLAASALVELDQETKNNLGSFLESDRFDSALAWFQRSGIGNFLGGTAANTAQIDDNADLAATAGGGLVGGMLGMKMFTGFADALGISRIPLAGFILGAIGFVLGMAGGAAGGDFLKRMFMGEANAAEPPEPTADEPADDAPTEDAELETDTPGINREVASLEEQAQDPDPSLAEEDAEVAAAYTDDEPAKADDPQPPGATSPELREPGGAAAKQRQAARGPEVEDDPAPAPERAPEVAATPPPALNWTN